MKNLLCTVEKAACEEGNRSVKVVHLKIGEAAGVSIDALNFAFEVLSKGTVAEGGKLDFERVPLRISCRDCGSKCEMEEFILLCKVCGSSNIEIISGREMEVDYILIDDKDDKLQ
ncbi:MAG: hydrogenase maturation nickel metallochaperone HypA [Candidatus Krumholzibacteria bacterium]|nr:hydrogenase maturation nickel metallochaperone HypA [Candidatus Krumholzibacteria bacterium]